MRRGMPALGLMAAGLYLTLAVAATVCPVDHAASHGARHHHAADALQSSLCAWACQVGSTSMVAPGWLPVGALQLLLLFSIVRLAACTRLLLGAALSRGPPTPRSV